MLLLHPVLAIMFVVSFVAVVLATRSPAWAIGLWGAPGLVIATLGSDPFPDKSVALFLVFWAVLAILFAFIKDPDALPLGFLFSPPLLATVGLAVLMVSRLSASVAPDYGSTKLQLFLAENISLLVAGLLIGRSRKGLELWIGLALVTDSISAIVLTKGIFDQATSVQSVGGRFALYQAATPIGLGRQTAAGMILAAFVLLGAGPVWRRFVAMAAVPFLAVGFAASGSRGPVLGLAAGLVIFVALTLKERESRRRLLLLVLGAFAAAVAIPQLVPGGTAGRAFSVLLGKSEDGESFSNGRLHLWGQAWRAFRDHPLLGIGTGGFGAINPIELYPHNILLETAAELGVLGLLLVLALLVFTIRVLYRVVKRSEGEDRRRVALVTALFGSAVVNASVSADITTNSTIWLLAGLALGLTRLLAPEASLELLPWGRDRLHGQAGESGGGGGEPPRAGPEPRRGGVIVSPAPASAVRGLVRLAAEPAKTAGGIRAVAFESSTDGRVWSSLADAEAEDVYEVFLVSRGPGGRRRQLGVIRTLERAEQLRTALEAEYAGGPERVEIVPSSRRPVSGEPTHGALWDTTVVGDGIHRLRPLTIDGSGRRFVGAETIVTVDNSAPQVSVAYPGDGDVLEGSVELLASARDQVSGIRSVHFEISDGDSWETVARVAVPPYAARWDAASFGGGEYDLRAVATDAAGNASTSAYVRIGVERVETPVEAERPIELHDPGPGLAGQADLSAEVGDPDQVAWVEYQAAASGSHDWQPLVRVADAPFAAGIDTEQLPDGEYDLRVVVGRRSGEVEASRALRDRRVDNRLPAIAMREPPPGSWVSGTVPLGARASAHSGGPATVLFEFSLDGERWQPVAGVTLAGPDTASWDTEGLPDGEYLLRATATDRLDRRATSDAISVQLDNTPPESRLAEPLEMAVIGGHVRLFAETADAGSGVVGVRFEYARAADAWKELGSTTNAPYAALWDTTNLPNGAYQLRCIARDRVGNDAASEPVLVMVANSALPERDAPPLEEGGEPTSAEPVPAVAAPEPERPQLPRLPVSEAASLWQLERLASEQPADDPLRQEREALIYSLRTVASPDGTIPQAFWSLIEETFGDLLA